MVGNLRDLAVDRHTGEHLTVKESSLADLYNVFGQGDVFKEKTAVKSIIADSSYSFAENNVFKVNSAPRQLAVSVLVSVLVKIGDISLAVKGKRLCHIVKAPRYLRSVDFLSRRSRN